MPSTQSTSIIDHFADLRNEPRLVAIATASRERSLAERRKLDPIGAPN